MQFQVEDISPVEKKLAVEIPWEQVRDRLDAAFRELGKGAELRGFRKGKVPRSVLEKVYGKKVQLEVAKDLVTESFLAAAREHSILPVAEPVVDDATIRAGETFRYSARVEVRGKVEVTEFEKLEATRHRPKITDEDVAHALERKRAVHTEYRVIEGRDHSAESDVLIVAIKGTVGELPVDRPEVTVDLGLIDAEPIPGLARALSGIPLDAKDREIVLAIPEDAGQKELAGKTATLHVTVKDAREKLVPALDDEFAKDTGLADTLAELRAKMHDELEKMARAEAERQMRDALLRELVKRNPVTVAPALIERGIDSQIERLRLSLGMQGVDLSAARLDSQAVRERLRDSAAEELRGQLLLDALADREKIAISEADVDARVAELAAMREKPAHKLKAEFDRDGTLETIRWRLRQEKTLDLLVERATITETDA